VDGSRRDQLGVVHNWRFKRSGLIGNLMVSFSVGMTFVFGGISVEQPGSINVWWFGAIALLMDLGEEIAADAMDIEGEVKTPRTGRGVLFLVAGAGTFRLCEPLQIVLGRGSLNIRCALERRFRLTNKHYPEISQEKWRLRPYE